MQDDDEVSTKKGFLAAVKRLITNKLLILNFISGFFWTFAMSGFTTFAPKFFEVNFQLKRSSASGYVGAVGPLSKGIGLLGSGKFLSWPSNCHVSLVNFEIKPKYYLSVHHSMD